MKLTYNQRIAIIVFSIIAGLVYAGLVLKEQRGELGQTEFIAIGIAAAIATTITVVIIKIKRD